MLIISIKHVLGNSFETLLVSYSEIEIELNFRVEQILDSRDLYRVESWLESKLERINTVR